MPEEKKKIQNTVSAMQDPGEARSLLAMALLVGGSNALEMRESEGQRELVASSQLPTRGLDDPALAMIRVIGPTPGDPLFSDVELPAGWRKQATDHAMWSNLLDEKGRKRAGVFYKAAFYDRAAHISPNRRFDCGRDYDYSDGSRFRVIDNASGAVLFVTDVTPDPFPKDIKLEREECQRRIELENESAKVATAWCDERFPDWRNTAAYWD